MTVSSRILRKDVHGRRFPLFSSLLRKEEGEREERSTLGLVIPLKEEEREEKNSLGLVILFLEERREGGPSWASGPSPRPRYDGKRGGRRPYYLSDIMVEWYMPGTGLLPPPVGVPGPPPGNMRHCPAPWPRHCTRTGCVFRHF